MDTKKPACKRAACNRNHVYNRVLYYLEFIQYPQRGQGWYNLHWQSYAVTLFAEQRAKAQKKPIVALESGVIVYCTLNGLLTEEEWESMNARLYRDSVEWRNEIDALFFKAMGRLPDRTTSQTTRHEGLEMWDKVKLPYTEEQIEMLGKAHKYHYLNRKKLTSIESRKYYYQAPDFDDMPGAKAKDDTTPKDDASGNALRDWLEERLDRQDDLYGGRYGYGVRMPRKQKEEPVIEPEQVDAHDQARIDAAFLDIMEGFDL